MGQRRPGPRLHQPQHRRVLLDEGAWPVRAQGSGGRCYRGDAVDQNFDHYSVEYTFADGTKLFLNARNMAGCYGEFASYAHGTKGSAVISTFMHTPAKCRIYKGHNFADERPGLGLPAARAESVPARMGPPDRSHPPGQALQRGQARRRGQPGADHGPHGRPHRPRGHLGRGAEPPREFAPGVDKLTMDSPAPLPAGPDGKYPLPQPGMITKREY